MSNLSYKSSGVDKEEGYRAVDLMKESAMRTFNPNVLNTLGGFGAMFEIPAGFRNPVLVSGADGVGTKLRIAIMMNRHDTIGQDLVAMCANDVLCHGAKPLFFLDYYATGKLDSAVAAEVVGGIARACEGSGIALIGGETAEMPGIYSPGDYDLAGFCVGIVEKERIVGGQRIKEGDKIIGISSSGPHSNGFSLIRRLMFDMKGYALESPLDDPDSGYETLGGALLAPTRIYVNSVMKLLEKVEVKGMAHITGGGLYENVPRMFCVESRSGLGVEIDSESFDTPAIFKLIQHEGGISDKEMYGTFNMGIGFVVCVSPESVGCALATLKECGEKAYVIGEVVKGEGVTIS